MIEQINNSKKWPSLSPETDNNGNVLLRQNGKPFLYALERFPDLVKEFVNKVKELAEKENQSRTERKIRRNQYQK